SPTRMASAARTVPLVVLMVASMTCTVASVRVLCLATSSMFLMLDSRLPMERDVQWEDRIGRRLKLRDVNVLLAVVQSGSMARAPERLAVSHPVVSKAIADLERALGVRLLDRSRKGIEPTSYGQALLKRGLAAFDELRQGVKDIEFLADPTAG